MMHHLRGVLLAAVPSVPAWFALPAGMPWTAAFGLSVLALVTWTGISLYSERHRHLEFLTVVSKTNQVDELNPNSILSSLRPDPARWTPWSQTTHSPKRVPRRR